MSFWTALVAIVAIIAFASMRIAHYNSPAGRKGVAPPPADDGEKQALRSELADLRERLKVLERITTDAHTNDALHTRRVSDEIEALRDR